ncbi:acylneuraminate cytidylyltransferase family protein [bacterium]|nr:MAG: acylneuraminate cytidylyltransferase family protein [bacterium]
MPISKNKIPKILAIIPARGGSKGILGKNIAPLRGKPLLAWTIIAAKRSKYVDRMVVSSDDKKILRVAEKLGANTVPRPKALARDGSGPEEVVKHTLAYLKKLNDYAPDVIAYLQPTSPLRSAHDIDNAVNAMIKHKAGAVISVNETDKKYLKTFFIQNGNLLKAAVKKRYLFMNRQELPKIYLENGAIYLIRANQFKAKNSFFASRTIPYVMTAERSVDIDTPADLKLAAKYLNN